MVQTLIESVSEKKKRRLCLVLLALAGLILFTVGSARLPLIGSDEPRYAEVAREMLQTRDYFVPHLGGLAWFEKPVLLYWLMDLFYSLFGVTEFAARLPSAFASLGTTLLIYRLTSLITDWKRGITAGAVLATSAFFVVFSHAAVFDMLLTFCITSTFFFFLRYQLDPDRKAWLYAMYASAGIGVLAKGFVALILTGPAIIVYLVISKRSKELLQMRAFLGVIIIAAVTAIWFLPVSLIYGAQFWRDFFFQQQFVRYTTEHYHRSVSLFFYAPVLLLGTFPWTPAPLLGFPVGDPRTKILTRLSICWFCTTVLFFSLSRSKLPSYVLPAVPPFAIFSALALVNYSETAGWRKRKSLLLFALLNLLAISALFWLAHKMSVPWKGLWVAAIAIVTLTAISLAMALKRWFVRAFVAYSLVSVVVLGIFVFLLFPKMKWADSKKLSLDLLPSLTGTQKLVTYNVHDYVPLFYTKGRMELTPDGHLYNLGDYRSLYHYLLRRKQAYILVDNSELSGFLKVANWRVLTIRHGSDISIVQLQLTR